MAIRKILTNEAGDREWKFRARNSVNQLIDVVEGQNLGSFATGGRPTTTTIGASGFDTTLGKPIWWNGTVWKDATGATV